MAESGLWRFGWVSEVFLWFSSLCSEVGGGRRPRPCPVRGPAALGTLPSAGCDLGQGETGTRKVLVSFRRPLGNGFGGDLRPALPGAAGPALSQPTHTRTWEPGPPGQRSGGTFLAFDGCPHPSVSPSHQEPHRIPILLGPPLCFHPTGSPTKSPSHHVPIPPGPPPCPHPTGSRSVSPSHRVPSHGGHPPWRAPALLLPQGGGDAGAATSEETSLPGGDAVSAEEVTVWPGGVSPRAEQLCGGFIPAPAQPSVGSPASVSAGCPPPLFL